MNTADLRARILEEAKKSPAPTRAEHKQRVTIVVIIGTLATTALFFGMGGFAKGTRPLELMGFSAGFAFLAAIILTRLSAPRGTSPLPAARSVLVTACITAAPVLAVSVLAATMMWPPSHEDLAMKSHVACAVMTILQGALPLGVLIVPRRGSDPVHPVLTGAALGMTAGAWTAALAYLRCPHAEASHCILAHVVPTIALTAIGAVLGRMFLRVR